MNQKEVEFASKTEISAHLRKRMLPAFEQILREKLMKDAEYQGYRALSEPVVTWQEQAFVRIPGDDGYYTLAKCDADEPGAFFNVGVRMKVVKR